MLNNSLNDDLAFVLEGLEVGFQCEMVVPRSDILGEDLAALGNVQVGIGRVGFEVATHPTMMRAVSDL